MKKILYILISLAIIVLLSSCSLLKLTKLDDRADKKDIISFVKENEKLIKKCIENNNYDSLQDCGIIIEINPEAAFVEFVCGGSGFGSATSYCGFYYSANNDIREIWCAPPQNEKLIKSGNGYFWKEPNGDNTYYTEKISRYFYYYEASY